MRSLQYIDIYSGDPPVLHNFVSWSSHAHNISKPLPSHLQSSLCWARALCISGSSGIYNMVQLVTCPFCDSLFPIGDNITMLTTADWLLGSNSQSTAGLSTVSDTPNGQYMSSPPRFQNESTACGCPYWAAFFTDEELKFVNKKCTGYQVQNYKVPLIMVPFIQKLFGIRCNCVGIGFEAWMTPTGFESIVSQRSVCELAYSAFSFDVPWCFMTAVVIVCSACTLHYIFICVFKRIAPSSPYVSTLKQHNGNMSNMAANGFFNHEGTHWAWPPCPHCEFVLPKKSSSKPEVKWIDFKVFWAVRKLWNCFCSSITGLFNGAKVKQRSPHSLKKIFYTIHFLDVSIVLAHLWRTLPHLGFLLHAGADEPVIYHEMQKSKSILFRCGQSNYLLIGVNLAK